MELQAIQNKIYEIRGQKVMLDFDLAEMYGTETAQLKRAVRRNIERFEGDDFMFELTKEELSRCQFGILNKGRGSNFKYKPFAFTELGVAMLSSVLNSKTAIEINRNIMRAFVAIRNYTLQTITSSIEIKELQERIKSLEMSNVQLVNRLITNVCEIPSEKIKSGQLASYEWQQLDYKLKDLLDAPLYVDDTPSLSVFELRTKARRLVREHGVRIIIIDYLQLMNASGMAFGSRQEEVSTISRSLKGLAKELNIPIIALSQLNRGVESREGIDGKRPQLSDLRESGAIEQDADMVCFIHRPEYYKIYQDDRGNDLRGMAEIVIAKHRNGAVGEVLLRFKGEFTRFSNPEDDMVIPMPGEPAGAMLGSKLNAGAMAPPPPEPDFVPQGNNPFGATEGPLPF